MKPTTITRIFYHTVVFLGAVAAIAMIILTIYVGASRGLE